MKTRNINRLWNGYASLRDYEVKKGIEQGGLVLTLQYTEEKTTLLPRDLEQGISQTKQSIKSKFHTNQTYTLIDFKWKPDKQDENQIKMELS